ncbi:hypothetical protein D3C76_1334480 [compost metagenome]
MHAVQLQACAVARIDQRQGADGQTLRIGRHQEQADALGLTRLPGRARRHHIGVGTEAIDHPELFSVQAIALPFGLGLEGNTTRVVARLFVHGQGQALFATDQRR